MKEPLAHTIYDALCSICGAPESLRKSFVQYMGEKWDRYEFRFQGSLGFGGKFRMDHSGMRVDYYPEDRTPQRDATVDTINKELERFLVNHVVGKP